LIAVPPDTVGALGEVRLATVASRLVAPVTSALPASGSAVVSWMKFTEATPEGGLMLLQPSVGGAPP
jgi:hypothetical protein